MQQQTRQRQGRQRQSTPLPEKREGTRQIPYCCHAHRTLQHMVNTHRYSKTEERRRAKKGEERRSRGTNMEERTQWCSGITCVLAELRAHYPEHQHKEEERKRKTEKTGNSETRQGTVKQDRETPHTITSAALQWDHHANRRGMPTPNEGTPTHRQEGHHRTTPLHSPCRPTIHDAPTHHHDEGGADRGYPTT